MTGFHLHSSLFQDMMIFRNVFLTFVVAVRDLLFSIKQEGELMKIIVSLTSYPGRIAVVHEVIKTLLIQNMKPDRIILWLSQDEFAGKEKDLPGELLELIHFGLTICWCDDLKSHKKYFYAMQEFPDDIIITVDDDAYYSPRLTETLYKSFLKYPNAVSCSRANRIVIDKNGNTFYDQWEKDYRECCNEEMIDLLPVGVGGVLYPPRCLPKETFDREKIWNICPCQDDLWLKAMELKSNIPAVLVQGGSTLLNIMEEGTEHGLYNTVNKKGNDIALGKIAQELDSQTGEKNFLINRMLAAPYSVRNMICRNERDKRKVEKKFVETIKNRKLLIYGAGVGARLVIECLSAFDNSVRPYAVIVTDRKNNPEKLFGIPVYEADKLCGSRDEYCVIVSTAEDLHGEIEEVLKRLKFTNVFFVRDRVMGKLLHGQKSIFEAYSSFIFSLREA